MYSQLPNTDYIIIADIDEFQDWKQRNVTHIYDFIHSELLPNDYEYVMGYLVDRFAQKAMVLPFPNSISELFKLYAFKCDFTETIMRGWITKVCLFKNVYNISEGGHHSIQARLHKYENRTLAIDNASPLEHPQSESVLRYQKFEIEINHFKWIKSDIAQYLRARIEKVKANGFEYWQESFRALEWIEHNQGTVDLNHVKDLNCRLS